MKKKLIALSGFSLLAAPLWVFAQTSTGASCYSGQVGIQAVICKIGEILNTLIPILVVLGVVYFIWGVVQYVISSDEEAKASGRMRMIWGIIGLVVIVAMWGLVNIVTSTFNLTNNPQNVHLPCVPGTPCASQ